MKNEIRDRIETLRYRANMIERDICIMRDSMEGMRREMRSEKNSFLSMFGLHDERKVKSLEASMARMRRAVARSERERDSLRNELLELEKDQENKSDS